MAGRKKKSKKILLRRLDRKAGKGRKAATKGVENVFKHVTATPEQRAREIKRKQRL